MAILVNIDVPDLGAGVAFYTQAFGLTVRRHLGAQAAELSCWPVPVFLLEKAAGSMGAAGSRRGYQRHWTPVHLDVVVADIEGAVSLAAGAGAQVEQDAQTAAWGKIAVLADRFGHGPGLIEFLNGGYDELAGPPP